MFWIIFILLSIYLIIAFGMFCFGIGLITLFMSQDKSNEFSKIAFDIFLFAIGWPYFVIFKRN